MYKLIVSPDALQDLEEIKEYITDELQNVIAAKNTIKKITTSINKLKDHPFVGINLSAHIDIETNFRFVISGNYLVFYLVENSSVKVARVIYSGRDYVRILFGKNFN